MLSKFGLRIFLFASALVCAIGSPSGRIVGGDEATYGQFPYQISLRMNHVHTCGGSIISNRYILSAAHCVVESGTTPYDAKYFTIRAGTHNRIAGGVIAQVKRVIVHPKYAGAENDLSLLELEKDLVYSNVIQPIALQTEEVAPGSKVIISGWGLTVHGGDGTPIYLKWNTVEAISKTKCASKILVYTDAVICLDHAKDNGACNGDSGGPAAFNGKLVGVAGFVVPGCGYARPDGYAKVSYNIDWIRENMQ